MAVSFDYDSTLELDSVQDYAEKLIADGVDVRVITSRFGDDQDPTYKIKGVWIQHNNDDLYKVTDRLGIPRDKIYFTNGKPKLEIMRSIAPLWHLDDCWATCKELNIHSHTIGVLRFGDDMTWRGKCRSLLKYEKK